MTIVVYKIQKASVFFYIIFDELDMSEVQTIQ